MVGQEDLITGQPSQIIGPLPERDPAEFLLYLVVLSDLDVLREQHNATAENLILQRVTISARDDRLAPSLRKIPQTRI